MPIAALGPIIVLAVAWIAVCLRDVFAGPVAYLPRWAWALIVVVSVPLGGIAYFLVGRAGR